VSIAPQHQSDLTFSTTFILKSLTSYVLKGSSEIVELSHLSDLLLADDQLMNSDLIDIIIGAELYSRLILDGIRKGSPGQPIAQNSLGWIVSGKNTSDSSSPCQIRAHHCSLEHDLRTFWELEEIPSCSFLSPEEQQCESHVMTTHSRSNDGRYIVRLPFKTGPPH